MTYQQSMIEQAYKIFAELVTATAEDLDTYTYQLKSQPEASLEKTIALIRRSDAPDQLDQQLSFLTKYLFEDRACRVTKELLVSGRAQIQFIAADEPRIYTFEHSRRAYCIYGKALSAYRRQAPPKEDRRESEARISLVSLLQEATQSLLQQDAQSLLFQSGLQLHKSESYDFQDVTLRHQLPDETIEPVMVSHQVYSPFVPVPFAIVLLLPYKHIQTQHLAAFMRSSLLHVYHEESLLLGRIMHRELFHKNIIIRGIYFIEEGEVEATSGRVIARGWVTNGKCKNSGYGWRFKPFPFVRFLARNALVWKQFLNDIISNEQYPFKAPYILNLDLQLHPTENNLKARRSGRKSRLPQIQSHHTVDNEKMIQIEKIRHYDDRLGNMCEFKHKLLLKKLGGSLPKSFDQIGFNYETEREVKRKNRLTKEEPCLKIHASRQSSTENILIMSVLRKLDDLAQEFRMQDAVQTPTGKVKFAPILIQSHINKRKRFIGL